MNTRLVPIIEPDTSVTDEAGMCLRFAQKVFSAPVRYPSAKVSSDNTKYRTYSRNLPDVPVLLWFDHWGTYGGVYANWGHVAVWVPGAGILTSPFYARVGQEWYSGISEVESVFSARYLFYSLDINSLSVAKEVSPEPAPPIPQPPILGEIMAFKSVGIGYRPNEAEDRLITVGLDFESGQRTKVIGSKSYCESWYGGLTDGGFKILTKGHYDNVLSEFDVAVAEKRNHELALAVASAGK